MTERQNERASADKDTRLSAHEIYDAISLDGEHELGRPPFSLWWSAIAAGFAISLSILTKAFLHEALPEAPWAPLVTNLGYAFGFVVVILGRMQLFTENTITVVLPLISERSPRLFGLAARLWCVVLVGNLVGTFIATVFIYYGVATPEQLHAMVVIAEPLFSHGFGTLLLLAIPAGFLVAAIVWMLPNAQGVEMWLILLVAYVIGIGHLVHIIVGSSEAFLMWLDGHVGLMDVFGHFLLPAFIGNVIGGTLLFSLLAYGQVQEEV